MSPWELYSLLLSRYVLASPASQSASRRKASANSFMAENQQTGPAIVDVGELPLKSGIPQEAVVLPPPLPRVFDEAAAKYRSCGVHARSFTMGVAIAKIALVIVALIWMSTQLCHLKRVAKQARQDAHSNRTYYHYHKIHRIKMNMGLSLLYLIPLGLLLHGAIARKWGYLVPYLICLGMALMWLTYCMVITALVTVHGGFMGLVPMCLSLGVFALFAYIFARVLGCITYIQDYQRDQEMSRMAQAMVFVPTGPPAGFGPPAYTQQMEVVDNGKIV